MENVKPVTKVSAFEKRIHEIDLARGILMCLVIMDHLFNLLMSYNKTWMGPSNLQPFATLYKIFNFYWTHPIRKIVQYGALGSFCFVSGISSAFSRNNWKRAWQMIIVWAAIFVGSNILQLIYSNTGLNLGIRTCRVDFNIIGVLAFSTLIYCFFQKKNWKWLLGVAGIGIFIHIIVEICFLINPNFGENIYMPLLWKPSAFVADQADHMPLFPYISFFFLGALLSYFTYSKEKKSYFKRKEWERPICFLGRHSLIVYATHFIILIGIFALIDLFI